jgi:hypothetical protein
MSEPNVDTSTIRGQLPDTFLNLPNLRYFDISDSQLYGSVPPSLVRTHPLASSVYIRKGYLSGPLPEIGPTITALFVLYLFPHVHHHS